MFQKWGWNVVTYLSLLLDNRSGHTFRLNQKAFLRFVYVTLADDERLETFAGSEINHFLNTRAWDWVVKKLLDELQNLITHESFAEFKGPSEQSEWSSLSPFAGLKDAMSTCAPRWLSFIDAVARFKSEASEEVDNTGGYLTILSVLCHLLHPRKSSNFQIMFALYLYHGNARRRVIDSLCSLGLTSSYKTMKGHMNSIHEKGCIRNKVVGHAHSTVLTYDNLEFPEGRRGERIGETRRFRSITSALMFEPHDRGAVSLLRSMWNPQEYPLSPEMIVSSAINDAVDEKVTTLGSLYISIG